MFFSGTQHVIEKLKFPKCIYLGKLQGGYLHQSPTHIWLAGVGIGCIWHILPGCFASLAGNSNREHQSEALLTNRAAFKLVPVTVVKGRANSSGEVIRCIFSAVFDCIFVKTSESWTFKLESFFRIQIDSFCTCGYLVFIWIPWMWMIRLKLVAT